MENDHSEIHDAKFYQDAYKDLQGNKWAFNRNHSTTYFKALLYTEAIYTPESSEKERLFLAKLEEPLKHNPQGFNVAECPTLGNAAIAGICYRNWHSQLMEMDNSPAKAPRVYRGCTQHVEYVLCRGFAIQSYEDFRTAVKERQGFLVGDIDVCKVDSMAQERMFMMAKMCFHSRWHKKEWKKIGTSIKKPSRHKLLDADEIFKALEGLWKEGLWEKSNPEDLKKLVEVAKSLYEQDEHLCKPVENFDHRFKYLATLYGLYLKRQLLELGKLVKDIEQRGHISNTHKVVSAD